MSNFIVNLIVGWFPVILAIVIGGFVLRKMIGLLSKRAPKAGLGLGVIAFCSICIELIELTVGAFQTGLCPGNSCWTISYFYIFGLLALSAAACLVTACRETLRGKQG
jgi:hypothetical protein